jgi:hypothetical protein
VAGHGQWVTASLWRSPRWLRLAVEELVARPDHQTGSSCGASTVERVGGQGVGADPQWGRASSRHRDSHVSTGIPTGTLV